MAEVEAVEPELTEDRALALLKQPDLSAEYLTIFCKNGALLKYRKVKLAIVRHARTPRHILMPLLRQLFTFDLMRVALTPAVAADIKIAAEDSLIHRIEKLSLGEKVTLARRASGRVAAALLNAEPRVIETALQNGRLTESLVLKEISRKTARAELISAVSRHPKWILRPEIAAVLSPLQRSEVSDPVHETMGTPRAESED